jgi:hypothetical protein
VLSEAIFDVHVVSTGNIVAQNYVSKVFKWGTWESFEKKSSCQCKVGIGKARFPLGYGTGESVVIHTVHRSPDPLLRG